MSDRDANIPPSLLQGFIPGNAISAEHVNYLIEAVLTEIAPAVEYHLERTSAFRPTSVEVDIKCRELLFEALVRLVQTSHLEVFRG